MTEFYKILLEIMDEKNMNIPDVARACGLTDSTVRSIIDRKQKKVALSVAFKLHRGLLVSLERLNGEKEPIPDTPYMDTRLQRIVDQYHSMNLNGQTELAKFSDYLKTRPEYDKHSNVQTELNA